MKILITGAAGTIGQHLVGHLARDGHQVIAIYHTSTSPQPAPAGVESRTMDLGEPIRECPDVDIIVHAAAKTHLLHGVTTADYVHANIIGTINLCRWAASVKPKLFVYLSTLSVYGEVRVAELTEDTPLNKPAPYGASKYYGELIVQEYAGEFPSVCIRLPGVVGPNYFTPWIGSLVHKAARHDHIRIFNPLAPFNNVIDFQELAEFIQCAMQRCPAGSTLLNLAASEPRPIAELVDFILKRTQSRSEVTVEPTSRNSFWINTDQIHEIFNYSPTTTTAIIDRYIAENSQNMG